MTQVTALFELYKNLARSDKKEFVKLIEIEDSKAVSVQKKPSDYFGTMSFDTAEKLHAHVVKSRNEW